MEKKVHKQYIPPPQPAYTNEEVMERERVLREQIDAWGWYQESDAVPEVMNQNWEKRNPPGILWKVKKIVREIIIPTLLPPLIPPKSDRKKRP